MTYTQQKLMYAYLMLEQAKHNSNDYPVFIANLDAFVTDARSVTLIMQKEFDSINGFKEWYSVKQQKMKDNSDFDIFNKLRVDTMHVRPFDAVSKITTSFPGGMTIPGGKSVTVHRCMQQKNANASAISSACNFDSLPTFCSTPGSHSHRRDRN